MTPRISPSPRRPWPPRATPPRSAALFAVSAAQRVPLTFRSGGTSLSGQGVTDGILVDTRRHFRDIEVLDGGARVRVGPGATVRQVNARLAGYGRKLGPDPASEIACTLGGVVANNSSGMACGTVAQHLPHARFAGRWCCPAARSSTPAPPTPTSGCGRWNRSCTQGLLRLRDRVRGNPASVRHIEHQFAMKNTMGYGLNSFLDHTRPVDILAHLVVGSEGTLAFVASVVMRTVPLLPHAMTGPAGLRRPQRRNGFPARAAGDRAGDHRAAGRRVAARRAGRPAADDEPAAASSSTGTPPCWWSTRPTPAAAVAELSAAAHPVLAALPVADPAAAHRPTRGRGPRLWHTRKGLYATVAGARPSGTTALLEDIVVPVPALLDTCERLTGLFDRHGYADSVIFGHAKDGNIHFMLTEQLGGGGPLDRFLRLHRGHGGPRARARRFAQGRARHRPDDGAVRAPAVRRRAVRGDAGDQAAVRPDAACSTPAC